MLPGGGVGGRTYKGGRPPAAACGGRPCGALVSSMVFSELRQLWACSFLGVALARLVAAPLL